MTNSAAPAGPTNRLSPAKGRAAQPAHGDGAVVGNHRGDMQRQSASLYLSFDEAEIVAADLLRVWPGITGLNETPKSEAIADVVQRVLRKARAIVEERMEISEEELPY